MWDGPGDAWQRNAGGWSVKGYLRAIRDGACFDRRRDTSDGPSKRKLLLVNTRNRPTVLSIAGAAGGKKETVDQTTGFNPPVSVQLDSDKLELGGLAVQVITLP
jgi:hypothetical protein